MIVAVIDANVIASSTVSDRTPPGMIMDYWSEGEFGIALSEPLFGEVERTFEKPYFIRQAGDARIAAVLASLRANATFVPITAVVHGVATHPEDDVVIATS